MHSLAQSGSFRLSLRSFSSSIFSCSRRELGADEPRTLAGSVALWDDKAGR